MPPVIASIGILKVNSLSLLALTFYSLGESRSLSSMLEFPRGLNLFCKCTLCIPPHTLLPLISLLVTGLIAFLFFQISCMYCFLDRASVTTCSISWYHRLNRLVPPCFLATKTALFVTFLSFITFKIHLPPPCYLSSSQSLDFGFVDHLTCMHRLHMCL